MGGPLDMPWRRTRDVTTAPKTTAPTAGLRSGLIGGAQAIRERGGYVEGIAARSGRRRGPGLNQSLTAAGFT